jgi:hypothetical protein
MEHSKATLEVVTTVLQNEVAPVETEEESNRDESVVQATTPIAAAKIQPDKVEAQSEPLETEVEQVEVKAEEDVSSTANQDEVSKECAFVRHVTIPEYFCMSPNAGFCKVWAMRNTGNSTITGECTIRLISGHPFGSISENAHVDALPGEEFLVTLSNRTAPVFEKSYSGIFQLHDADGNAFGDELLIE